MTRRSLRLSALLAMCLMFAALFAAAHISRDVLERLPRLEDEFAYLYQARIFARLQAWVPREEPVKVFWQPFVLQPETTPDGTYRRFGKYIPGWPLALTPGVWMGQPWVVNAFLGMLSVGLVYRLGREVFDEWVGLVAALLLTISPMALILNATLMSHTWAMFCALVFTYSYWRALKQGAGRWRWAALGGVAIGAVIITRPLTAAAIGAPVALHALIALGQSWRRDRRFPRQLFITLAVMAVCSAPVAAIWPLFNQIWVGDWRANTYTLLWEYDRVGFGPGYGLNRGGHSLYWGLRNMQADLTMWFRDLYGFTLTNEAGKFLKENLTYGAGVGISWLPVVIGLLAGWRRGAIWLFFGLLVGVVAAGITYWIGSVVHGGAVYSTRYYYEATFGVCLVAAYGIVAVIRAVRPRGIGLAALGIAVVLSVGVYTPARLREPLPPNWKTGLYGFNKVSRAQLEKVDLMRLALGRRNDPVLIVVLRSPVKGVEDNWRDYGATLAVTDPYLDSDIIVARVFEAEDAPEVVRRFPGRLVLYQIGEQLYSSVEEALTKAAG